MLKILQWNLLSQKDIYSSFHPDYYDDKIFDWIKRLNLFIKFFQKENADILCLQEVDKDSFINFSFLLEKIGYDKHICKFKSDADRPIGCATFWKSNINCVYCESGNLDTTNQVYIHTKFIINDEIINVFNTHFKAKPEFEETRIIQIKFLYNIIEKIKKEKIILCGDFNAELNETSMLIIKNLLTYLGNENSYSTYKMREKEKSIKRAIDHAFGLNIKLLSFSRYPQTNELLPNENFPSDHCYSIYKIN